MKLEGRRKSTNVQDRTRDTSAVAPHRNPDTNPFLKRYEQETAREFKKYGERTISKTMADKGNPFRKMLKGMDKEFAQSQVSPRKSKIPTPTPRPNRVPIPTPNPRRKDGTGS